MNNQNSFKRVSPVRPHEETDCSDHCVDCWYNRAAGSFPTVYTFSAMYIAGLVKHLSQ